MALIILCDRMIRPAALAFVLIVWSLPAFGQQTFSTRDYFYVGGKYTRPPSNEVMAGQMYVEVLRPRQVVQKYPLVFFHGAGQTATNWMGTPDGRVGWADYFLAQGYVIYLCRSTCARAVALASFREWSFADEAAILGRTTFYGAGNCSYLATGPKTHTVAGYWHTEGCQGDPVFDAFYATQVEGLESAVETQTLVQAAGAALLDEIGPAILVTHSQSGAFGWLLADARPKTVKAIVAMEPNGPPFRDAVFDEDKNRAWGLTDIPITYAPPVKSPAELAIVQESKPDAPDLVRCWKQADSPRRLVNLQGIPVLVVTAEASYHAPYDQCTSRFLAQAGVANTHWRLEDQGIHGNGHMLMIEKNSLEIAALLQKWIIGHVQ